MEANAHLEPPERPSRASRDRVGIAELARRMCETWNMGDASAYADIFTGDCDYIAFDGTHLKGRDQNARHRQALFDTVLKLILFFMRLRAAISRQARSGR